jgi:N-acetylglucosamine kinase-like BadF-type ATPase
MNCMDIDVAVIVDKDNVFLGIEGGGTKTTWAVVDGDERVLASGRASQGNLQVLGDEELMDLLREIACGVGDFRVVGIGAAFAGCHLEGERERLRQSLRSLFPYVERIVVGEDTHSALAGAHGDGDGICVIAGTGSNTFGRKGDRFTKAGGWGHLFADLGSSYDTARRGLQAVYEEFDITSEVGVLGRKFLEASGQRNLQELVPWILERSSKMEVAALARCVLDAAREGDGMALDVLRVGAASLALRVGAVARRLGLEHYRVGLIGGMFEHNALYVDLFVEALREGVGEGWSDVFINPTPGEVGAARLIRCNIPLEMNA